MRFLPVSAAFCLFTCLARAVDLYVSPHGSDNNSGSEAAPVQTLQKARDLGRESRRSNPDAAVTILMQPGTHEIRQTISFTKEDSGTESAPLTIRNWTDPSQPGGRPLLVGGVVVGGWKRSNFNGRSDVYEADLKPLGIRRKFRQIYLNGSRQIWARYPDDNPARPYSGGWAYVAGVRPPMYTDIAGERTDTVVMRTKDARGWARPTDGEICIFPRYNWWNRIVPIKDIDPTTRTVTLTETMPYAARPEDRYAVFGMAEELDTPGEWYQDAEGQRLYYIPPGDLEGQSVTVPTVSAILSFDGVSHLLIHGLELTCAENQAIELKNCTHATLEKLRVHDLGYMNGAGITIHNGNSCAVRGCDLWNIGGHGIEIYAGNAVKMERCHHIVDNCYIHHAGQFNRHGIGIMVSGAGVVMSHNLIHDMPRCGVFHGGVLHTLEYNRIRHCNLEMEDTGCTYGGGWTGGWTTIRYNHCTDSIGFNNHGQFFVFAWGIYLDESGCGYDVYGNIVERCQVGAMHLHNARENHIYNNIFANNGGIHGTTHQFSMQGWTAAPDGLFMKDRQPKMLKKHNELLENPKWAEMRGMHVSPADPFLPDGTIMRGNRIERNIFYYPEQPHSRYVKSTNVNLKYNTIDYNTLWSGSGNPIKTGQQGYGKPIADLTAKIPHVLFPALTHVPEELRTQLLMNPDQSAAMGWHWYHKPFPDARTECSVSAAGQPSLKIHAAFNPANKYIKHACVKSLPFALEPGKDYCLTFKLSLENSTGALTVRFVSENNGLWAKFGSREFTSKTGGTAECQSAFHFPAPGEELYDQRLGELSLQFEFRSATGTAEISELQLTAVAPATEWESWQQLGADLHSIVADPLFVDPAHGDFRLKPDSPALKQGFQPLPLEKIGPYESELRATWPIQEAEGVRENPQWLQSVPMD